MLATATELQEHEEARTQASAGTIPPLYLRLLEQTSMIERLALTKRVGMVATTQALQEIIDRAFSEVKDRELELLEVGDQVYARLSVEQILREKHGLSDREVETLKLLAQGLSNADIGKAMFVTEQTVKFHLTNVFRKLEVTNRVEASRKWWELVPPCQAS